MTDDECVSLSASKMGDWAIVLPDHFSIYMYVLDTR